VPDTVTRRVRRRCIDSITVDRDHFDHFNLRKLAGVVTTGFRSARNARSCLGAAGKKRGSEFRIRSMAYCSHVLSSVRNDILNVD